MRHCITGLFRSTPARVAFTVFVALLGSAGSVAGRPDAEVIASANELTQKRTVDYRMVPHPVSGVELPRISLPARPAAEQAVNAELESLAGDMMCASDTPAESRDYDSTVEVTYADNDVLSVEIHASFFCGGAHPVNDANLSVTFDLVTGRSVRFRELFEDYGRDSAKIAEAYVATLSADELEGCEDLLSAGGDTDGVVNEEDVGALEMYGFTYTLSPQGLTVQPSFPNVMTACAHPSTIPFAEIRELAAKESILMRAADAAR